MKLSELPKVLDLGEGRTLRFFIWQNEEVVAFDEYHPSLKDTQLHKAGEECVAGGYFDVPDCPPGIPDSQRWTVESWDPLTLSPSILCRICGNHGWIRDGKWISA